MTLKLFDWICLGGSLAAAIAYKMATGDAEAADRIGFALLMSWVAMQVFAFMRGQAQDSNS